jgi:hypothetical protein
VSLPACKLTSLTMYTSNRKDSLRCSSIVLIINYLLIHKTPVSRMKTGLVPSNQTCLTGLMPRKPRFVSRVKRHVSEKK